MSRRDFRHWTSTVPAFVKIARVLGYPRKLKQVVGDPRSRVGTLYPAIRAVAERHGAAQDLTPFEYRVFSQNGEDGVIAEIVRRLGADCARSFVEFGAGTGATGNTTFLSDVLGWAGLLIEPARDDFQLLARKYQAIDRVETACEFVNAGNVDRLLGERGEVGVLSIDVDGNDYYVWEALHSIRPAVVVIEYNGALPLRARLVQPLSTEPWTGTDHFGCSLGALVSLARTKGYVFVHTELTGTNAFFVRDDFRDRFSDLGPPPERVTNYELLGMTHPPDKGGRRYIDLEHDRPSS